VDEATTVPSGPKAIALNPDDPRSNPRTSPVEITCTKCR
jgi:hypothetical protein